MIKIAYTNVKNLDLARGCKLVSKDRLKKISRYKFDKDQKLSCGAALLLESLLSKENIRNPQFMKDIYEKPYISNYENIEFNISHSKNMVVCGISDKEIGIDIEYNDPNIDLNIAKNYFYNQEYQHIINSINPSDEFFNHWVLKESYMKYTGLGFHLKLDNFNIDTTNNDDIKLELIDKNNFKKEIKNTRHNTSNDKLNFSLFNIDNYKLAICSPYKVCEVREISVNNLYEN